MIVDAHHHLWTADYAWLADPALAPIRRDYTVADLRRQLTAASVTATVLVEAGRCDLAETTDFLAVAARTPEIAGVVGWVSLTDPDLPATLEALKAGEGGGLLVGVRDQVQGFADPDFLDRADVRRSLAVIGEAGLTFDLVVRADQLAACARAAAATPQTSFVLDHLGKPSMTPPGLQAWREAGAALAACPNVVAKLSGLLTEVGPGWSIAAIEPFVDTALELFGPDRLMVGSDWPVCELVATYAEALATMNQCLSELSPQEQASVQATTAIRTYRLEIHP